MSWTTVHLPAGDDLSLVLSLPPGWRALRPASTALAAEIRELVGRQTEGLPDVVAEELTAEFDRITRVASVAGALLLAGGAAVGEDDGRIVTASLMVAPYELYGLQERPQWKEGPVDRVSAPAGTAVRHTWLGTGPSPVGELLQLDVEYVVAPPVPPTWVLAFRTPALGHVPALLAVFDAITATLRVDSAAPVFS